jgi:Lon-like ATP-dependent protease
MQDTMEDNIETRRRLVRFVAQEVIRDGKIPHFDRGAVEEIIREGMRRAGRKGHFTLKLRDLGGLVRVSGDIARAEAASFTTSEHVLKAKKISRSVEQQLADTYRPQEGLPPVRCSRRRDRRVNGLLPSAATSGVMLPIVAEVTSAMSKSEGHVYATGKLQEIAKEAVQNVSAIIKKFTGQDIAGMDVHIQFVGTYDGVEGDSASVSIATAVISAISGIPVDQSVAMTGSLSVRGDVLPIGGVTYKIEAAANAGIKTVLIPRSNMGDVLIEDAYKDRIKIIPVTNISEVLEYALSGKKKESFIDKIKNFSVDKMGIGIFDKALLIREGPGKHWIKAGMPSQLFYFLFC